MFLLCVLPPAQASGAISAVVRSRLLISDVSQPARPVEARVIGRAQIRDGIAHQGPLAMPIRIPRFSPFQASG